MEKIVSIFLLFMVIACSTPKEQVKYRSHIDFYSGGFYDRHLYRIVYYSNGTSRIIHSPDCVEFPWRTHYWPPYSPYSRK